MMGSAAGEIVCVTGASGYIASYLVKLLLQRGYTVHATVRDTNDPEKTGHLIRLEGAKERLHLFKADLMDEGSFDAAISGCSGVFHTASPVNFNVKDPQVEVIDPAVKGMLNVLAACKRSSCVRRVIITSTAATVLFNGVVPTSEVLVDETWFARPEFCDVFPDLKWYAISKILAEEAALKFTKENGIDMVSMHPGMVIGPMLQPKLNDSVALIYQLVNGAETYPNMSLPWVHIQDAMEAHIRALELPTASGRYCVVESVAHYSNLIKLLREIYPTFQFPNRSCVDDGPLSGAYRFSKAKAESLGIVFTPLKQSLKDTVENLIEKKLLTL